MSCLFREMHVVYSFSRLLSVFLESNPNPLSKIQSCLLSLGTGEEEATSSFRSSSMVVKALTQRGGDTDSLI